MHHLNPQKAGFAVGFFLGGWHLIWSFLIAFGWAQPLMNFVLWAHMIHLQFIAGPFDLAAAAVLIIVTFLFGCVMGYIFATIWNWLHEHA